MKSLGWWVGCLGLGTAAWGSPPVDALTGLRPKENIRIDLKELRLYGDLNRHYSARHPKRKDLFYQFEYCVQKRPPRRENDKPKIACSFLNRTMTWRLNVKIENYGTTTTRPFSTLDFGKEGPTWTLSAEKLAEVAADRNPGGKLPGFLRIRLRSRGWFWSSAVGETQLDLPARGKGALPVRVDSRGYSRLDPKPLTIEGKDAMGGLAASVLDEKGEPAPLD